MSSLSIIIVNYNVKYFLEQCLHAVRKASEGLQVEVLVVDNASADGSQAYLEKLFPWVRFYWNKENMGFAKANNQALKSATGNYILFLNPDTIVPEDCFHLCMQFLNMHPEAGALGPRMLDGSGRFLRESKRGFPDPLTAFYKLTGLATLFSRSPLFARYHLGHLDPLEIQETDVLTGAFMLVRKAVLDSTGGFDEDYFMYGEDIDLSYRIRQKGWKNIYYPHCPIIHFKGESTRKGTLNYVRMFYGAMAIFASKHYGHWRAGLFSACIHLAILIRGSFSAIAGPLLRLSRERNKPPDHAKLPERGFLVIASESRFRQFLNQWNGQQDPIIPIVHFNPPKDGQSMDNWKADILMAVKQHKLEDLICCENGISFKAIITLMQAIPKNLRVRINANGSGSMVSDAEVITLPAGALS